MAYNNFVSTEIIYKDLGNSRPSEERQWHIIIVAKPR